MKKTHNLIIINRRMRKDETLPSCQSFSINCKELSKESKYKNIRHKFGLITNNKKISGHHQTLHFLNQASVWYLKMAVIKVQWHHQFQDILYLIPKSQQKIILFSLLERELAKDTQRNDALLENELTGNSEKQRKFRGMLGK